MAVRRPNEEEGAEEVDAGSLVPGDVVVLPAQVVGPPPPLPGLCPAL